MNPQQTIFLKELYPKFLKKQQNNRIPKFWSNMELAWFKRWPEADALGIVLIPDLDDPEGELIMSVEDMIAVRKSTKKQKEQLHAWFNNTSQRLKKASNGMDGSSQTPGKLAAQLFKPLDKRTQRWQHVEIWQKCHKAELDTAIDAEMKNNSSNSSSSDSDSGDSTNNDEGDWLSVWQKLVIEMWNAEEGEEREVILKIYDEQELPGSKDNTPSQNADKMTPEE
ncbi:hypothetical protein C8R44DRAFT_889057 [Mycena epipterygia]|nr:hypothetical protein C8R44DRAFT_889057 [Mycena epipterygia]